MEPEKFSILEDYYDMEPEFTYSIRGDWDEWSTMKGQDMTSNQQQFWMVTGDGNAPKVRHFNKQDAVREATRLAEENPGKEFFVLQAVDMLVQPSGVVRTRF